MPRAPGARSLRCPIGPILATRGGNAFGRHTDGPENAASRAVHQPENVIDFGCRSVNQTAVKAKAAVAAHTFMVPGMGPCRSGSGPDHFARMAIITDWVEPGKASDCGGCLREGNV